MAATNLQKTQLKWLRDFNLQNIDIFVAILDDHVRSEIVAVYVAALLTIPCCLG